MVSEVWGDAYMGVGRLLVLPNPAMAVGSLFSYCTSSISTPCVSQEHLGVEDRRLDISSVTSIQHPNSLGL